MIQKAIEQIAQGDLEALVTNGVPESKTIDYKQVMPGLTDADKKEFLADVSSFANTAGGDLIFGITESQGLPSGIPGVSGDLDLELRRLDSIISAGIDPRIRYSSRIVECGSEKVAILRIERSWTPPHRVVFKGHDKFYGRNSAGKYPLDVTELRSAFTLASSLTDRIAAFRTDRIIALSNNDTPIPFTPEAKIILHCIPVESFSTQTDYNVLQYFHDPPRLRPIYFSGWDRRINLEGVISFSGNTLSTSYTQLYRTGIIEAVTGALLQQQRGDRVLIPSVAYEREILKYLADCFRIFREIGVSAPVLIALTLTGVKGFEMGVGDFGWDSGNKITSDTLLLPGTLVEDLATPVTTILKPTFDLVWNACGYPVSKNFDENGQWVNRQ